MKRPEVRSIDAAESVDNNRIVADQETFAVKKLQKGEPVTHKLGSNCEYEIRTTLTVNRRTWRASCQVRCNGVEMVEFHRLTTDRSHRIRHLDTVSEALQIEFTKEAVNVHFDRLNAVKEYIAQQEQHSNFRPNITLIALLVLFFSLIASAGYWFFGVGKNPSVSSSSPIKPEFFHYNCNRAEPCNVSLPLTDENFQPEIMEIEKSELPRWLTFDSNHLALYGKVPVDEPNQSYIFQIHIKDQNRKEHIFKVHLKINGHQRPPSLPAASDPPAVKPFDPQPIDEDYLQRLLDDQQH